jgi:rhamnogalacturonan endolyase
MKFMKKQSLFILFLLVCAPAFAAIVEIDVSSKITNPGFESNLTGWTVQNGVFSDGNTLTPTIETAKRHSGTNSLYFGLSYGPQFTAECRVYQTVTGLTPGNYKLVCWKRYGRWEAANGLFANGGSGDVKFSGTNSGSDFIEQSVTFTVDAGGTAVIGAYASSRRSASDRNDYFWLDDFALYQLADDSGSQMEYLDRGLLAIKTSSGVFLSWRLLGTDDLANTTFKLYRASTLVYSGPLTNYQDASGTVSSSYTIKAYVNNTQIDQSDAVTPWANAYKTIQLNRPSGGTTPDDVAYTYTPNDCSVGDLDGDGQYEIIVKWDPSNSKDNSQSGYTGNVFIDAYKLNGTFLWRVDLGVNIRAGAHYTQFLVYDFDGDGKAEMVCKTAPGSKDGLGNYVRSVNNTTDYRNSSGYVLSGNEYLTVFGGTTGQALATVDYEPARGTVGNWGDTYGNRVDRFLACVAYLDGIHPSIVVCRGYYTRLTAVAYDFNNGTLSKRWIYDSGNTESASNLYGQGNHNLSVGDVDNDGKDEIILGSGAIDDNGTMLYRTGLGHGDAMHLSDLDPTRPGLEVWAVHEEKGSGKWNYELHDAKTGEIIWYSSTYDTDTGRGLAADIDGSNCGFEMWSSITGDGTFNHAGTQISAGVPKTNSTNLINFRIYWDGDLQDELLDGDKIADGNGTRLLTASQSGAASINSTKANPCLQADILGDWREEVIYYNSSDPSQLMLFATTTPSDYRLYTLMHDHIYRMGIAWQNVGYNQPPHLGFFIGCGLDGVPVPNIFAPSANVLRSSMGKDNYMEITIDDPVVKTVYYNLQGVEISCPANTGIYIEKKIHASRKVEVNKVFFTK